MGKVKGDKRQMRKISSIAAHVPDLVVYSDFSKIVLPYVDPINGVLLFADVSGLLPFLLFLTR